MKFDSINEFLFIASKKIQSFRTLLTTTRFQPLHHHTNLEYISKTIVAANLLTDVQKLFFCLVKSYKLSPPYVQKLGAFSDGGSEVRARSVKSSWNFYRLIQRILANFQHCCPNSHSKIFTT